MLSGASTILFSAELFLPPVPEYAIGKDQVRQLYNKLHEPDGYPYENVDIQAQPPTLSTNRESGRSLCQVGPDKIRVVEENPDFGIDDFVSNVETILKALGDDVGPFFLLRCTIQSLAQPNNCSSSLDLLAGNVANVMNTIDPFERPPSYFGLRFRFSPHFEEVSEETAAEEKKAIERRGASAEHFREVHKGFCAVRFETYHKDLKQIWMEVASSYPGQFSVAAVQDISANIRNTYQFLTEKCKNFLDQFDQKPQTEDNNEPK